jgi:hypothetical protein
MVLAMLLLVAPIAKRALKRRSTDTVGSPYSILATLDWLELSFLASSGWLSRRFLRHWTKAWLRAIFMSSFAGLNDALIWPAALPFRPQ